MTAQAQVQVPAMIAQVPALVQAQVRVQVPAMIVQAQVPAMTVDPAVQALTVVAVQAGKYHLFLGNGIAEIG